MINERVSHFMMRIVILSFITWAILGSSVGVGGEYRQYKIKDVSVLEHMGGRVDWSHKLDLIAFDKKGKDGLFNLYTMKLDGTDIVCLTCNQTDLPRKHRGQPAWHPSGKYIVFQVENKHSKGTINEQPSLGINNDLFLATADGKSYWKLTDNPPGYAALHPKFSYNGEKLLWSERYERGRGSRWGHWRLAIADFDEKSHGLTNLRTIQPRGARWYESHGFTPDGKKIYFSGNLNGGRGNDIYCYGLANGNLVRLTGDKNVWDEMAELSPSGDKIAFISNRFDPGSSRWGFLTLVTEIYLMDPDGKNVQRITHLNDKNHSYVIGDLAWSPDGKTLLGVAFERKTKMSVNVKVEFK